MKRNRAATINKSRYTNIRRFFPRIINWNFELKLFEPRARRNLNNCEFIRHRQLSFPRKVTPIKTRPWSDSNGILFETYKWIFRPRKQPGKRELHIVLRTKNDQMVLLIIVYFSQATMRLFRKRFLCKKMNGGKKIRVRMLNHNRFYRSNRWPEYIRHDNALHNSYIWKMIRRIFIHVRIWE